MAELLPTEQKDPAKVWAAFIKKLREAGDGNYNSVQELQALCLRASYDMGDLHAQLMTARDSLREIKASATEGLQAADGALESAP